DPPLAPAFVRLDGCVHRYPYDQFFPAGVPLPEGCSGPWLFNQQFLCPCHREEELAAPAAVHAADLPGTNALAIAPAVGGNGPGEEVLAVYHGLLRSRKYKYAVVTLDFPAPTGGL